MPDFKNYDPAKYVLTFKGIIFRGFAEGTFIKIERLHDAYTMSVGSGGDVVRVRNRNRTGSITVMLQSPALTNDLLTNIALLDESHISIDSGVGPVILRDLNGYTLISSQNAWIRKMPNVEAALEHTHREWILDCAELYMFVGSAFR